MILRALVYFPVLVLSELAVSERRKVKNGHLNLNPQLCYLNLVHV